MKEIINEYNFNFLTIYIWRNYDKVKKQNITPSLSSSYKYIPYGLDLFSHHSDFMNSSIILPICSKEISTSSPSMQLLAAQVAALPATRSKIPIQPAQQP